MNELARADNDGCCVKTTIAVAKHRLILKTKTAVFFNDMVFYPFMLWLVQREQKCPRVCRAQKLS